MYQVTVTYTSNSMDNFPGGLVSALGPNGEILSDLQTEGWVFTRVGPTTLSITRPNTKQIQPLVNIMTHGVDGNNVWSKTPSGVATGTLSALQTKSGSSYTTLTLYTLNSASTGFPSSGAGTLIITFGLIS
jgi:hypothetical protein